ncbi:MAG: hypothetical protein HYZ75_11270 [Elusimicrobia bacterium]|nr:hypothetical protein [Elusimicrobiota bacterium]
MAAALGAFGATSAGAQNNPSMAEDYGRIMNWLTKQTADGLGFNAGSSFDPPTEMRAWRLQPDVSLGVGLLPFNKGAFPQLQVASLAEKKPDESLPDRMMFPNLTFHMRMGMPGRTDMGFRFANMTTPDNYKLSPTTTGDGQSNTLGVSLRRHFMGGHRPLLSVSAVYNHTFGYFNFRNEYKNIELTPGFNADSTNFGTMEWDVRSFGMNLVASQAFGKYIPFAGFGYNRAIGSVSGKLEAQWQTPAIPTYVGRASNDPAPDNGRVILGFQRDGSFFKLFMNTEIKAIGPNSGSSFVVSTGLAAPFKMGATSALVRQGRNRKESLTAALEESPRPASRPRLDRYWTWDKTEAAPAPKKTARERQPELIFIR